VPSWNLFPLSTFKRSQPFHKKSTDWGLYVRTESKKSKRKKALEKNSENHQKEHVLSFNHVSSILFYSASGDSVSSAPEFSKTTLFSCTNYMTNAFFTGFRRRYPLLACYAPRRFFPLLLSAQFSAAFPKEYPQGWFSSCQALDFSPFFPFFFFLHKWKDGNRSTMRKENMYNINKRGRKKNQQILLGDFAGVLRVWYTEENGESVLILSHFSFLIPLAPI